MADSLDIDAYLIPGTDRDVLDHYRSLAQAAKDAQLSLVEDEYAVVDTETTGLDQAHDALIEIAAVRLHGSRIVDRFQTFVDPGRHIPAEITELTGITDADVAGAPDPSLAVELLAQFCDGLDLVAHNAQFDKAFIMREAVPGAMTGRWIDSLALSHIAFPRFKTHRLADLSRAFGTHRSSHRAMDDVLALAELWRIMLTAIHAMPAGLPGLIAQISPDTSWPLRSVFQHAAAANAGVEYSLRRARRERCQGELAAQKYDADEVQVAFPPDQQVQDEFSAGGSAGKMYAAYEQREEQVQMALEVNAAFRESGIHVLEAGTGVGKSMAYLLPLALLAQRNAITCGIATKTNALMDQLVYHELPRLDRALGGVSYIALKGYEHYPCLRKLERRAQEAAGATAEEIEMLATLYAYVAQTSWGDLDALNLHWNPGLRKSIEASSQTCLKRRCPYFPRSCFLHGARRNAKCADIVITNHALLFRDVQLDGGILPPVRYWVVDEAHSAESEARKQLSLTASARELDFLFTRLASSRSGVLAQVRKKASELEGGDMLYGVTADIDTRVGQAQAVATSFFSLVKDLAGTMQDSSSGYDRITLWVGPELRESGAWAMLGAPGRSLAAKLDGISKRLRDLSDMIEQFEGVFATQETDVANACCDLDGAVAALNLVLGGDDDSYVCSAELDRNPERIGERLVAEKLDIGAELASSLYPACKGIVFTSATLSTGSSRGPFAHFTRVMGLDGRCGGSEVQPGGAVPPQAGAAGRAPGRVRCVQLASSYDFDRQMAVYLPTDMPDPNAHGYRQALQDLLLQVHFAMGGSTLTLFTNRREMEAHYHALKPLLQDAGLGLVAQTRGTSTKNLRDRFLEDQGLSMFALRSFWDGFDAPGDTLRCVIIPRLPFGRPTDPISCERELRDGRAAWGRYALPEAVMSLKQAAGRLIRSSTDSGNLILADARLQTKSYGKTFLQAMPTTNIRAMTASEICKRIAAE